MQKLELKEKLIVIIIIILILIIISYIVSRSGFYPENFNKVGWKTLDFFWKTLEKQGSPPLKNKNSSDLAHFEIKFVKKGEFFFSKIKKKFLSELRGQKIRRRPKAAKKNIAK